MSKLRLSLCCGYYDRTRALFDGTVRPEGIDLICSRYYGPPDGLFVRAVKYGEYDVCEFSFSNYIYARDLGKMKYVALPIFVSRKFRLSDIYINTRSGIRSPSDLNGRRIASPRYYVTASVWQRGILQEMYDVMPEKISWFTDREERLPIRFPDRISVKIVDNIDSRLEKGDIDALIGPRKPSSFPDSPTLGRLFPDPMKVEKEYFKKTGIFPTMHVILVRDEIWRENKWVAPNLVKAFSDAKRLWREDTATRLGGPAWIELLMEEERAVLGEDLYNIKDNRKTIETLVRYCSEQAIMNETPTVEELFVDNID